MENGVGIVNESRLRDENLSSRGEEIITEGSEGDDVFEEAIAAEMPVVDSENVVIEGGDDKKMENLEARLEDDGNPNLGHETDKFEEAIEAPTESNKEEEPSVIDGVAAEEVMNGEDEITQTAETHDSGEMEMAEKSGLLIQKPENGVSDQIDADNHENQSHTEPEPVNTDKVEGVESVIGKNVESNGEILHEAEKKDEVTETKGILVTAQEEQTHTEPETIGTNRVEGVESGIGQNVESNGEILHEAEKKDEVNETTCILDTLQEEQSLTEPETIDTNKAEGVESDIGQNVESNGEILHEAEKNHELNEPPGILDTSHEEQTHTESEAIDTNEVEGISGSSQKVESNGEFLHKVEKKEEVNETPDILEAAHEEQTHSGAESRDTNEVDGVSGSSQKGKSNGEILHESKENVEVNESPSLLDKGEEMKEKLVTFETNLKEEKIEESKETAFGRPVPQIHDSKGSSGLTDVKTRSSTLNVGTGVSNTKEEEGKGSSSIKKPVNPPPAAARPAGLGRTVLPLEPIPRAVQQPRVNGAAPPPQNQLVEDSANGEAEENDETREKLQMIRVKFLRLARRLGQTPHNVVVAQVLYRLGLAEQLRGRNGGRVAAFSFDRASAMAEQLEAAGQEPLDFSCTIMVLGKTGVGKSATINSIFDEVKFGIDAFDLGTRKVQEVVGTVQGIKVRVIDTPGLLPSWSDQRQNEKILHSIKRFIKNTPPDIVLYLDRLDMQSRDFGDMPLLRTITEIFGPSIWFNAIVVLTHAASAPPEGPNGTATSYDMFVTQRSHVVQQAIRQAAGDMRLMNPVSLVENHLACRTNRAGQRVLPNGQVWKSHLLLLSFASKILAEANTLLKLQDSPPGKPFASRIRAPPLPFLLSSLLQSRPQVKLPSEQFGDDDDDALDDDSDESMLSDDDSEYDDLPPFKPLTKTQLSKLTKAQKKAYFDELEYREKLLMKKQLKEEKRRRRFMKKMADSVKDLPVEFAAENVEEENSNAASVPVPMPDLPLPASFDSDNPTHRYRCLDSLNQWLVRPVLENHGWDHDVGYEGINVEKLFVVKDKIPISFSGQVSKDKKDTNVQMDVASTLKHGDAKSTSVGFDVQTIGKDIAYTLRSDTRFTNYRHNRATAGLSVTLLGDVLTGGMKIEDKLVLSKRGQVVVSGGAIVGRGDVAYGGSLEATLRDKDHPLGRFLTTMGLSVMDWHGDLAVGGNAQTQIPIGRSTNLIGRVNFNNRGSGQVSVRLNSSEHLQIALVAVLPLLRKLFGYSLSGEFGQ